MYHNVYVCTYYLFIIGTVDTPSLQGRIAAQGDAEKVRMYILLLYRYIPV